jgi:hypothetical protein
MDSEGILKAWTTNALMNRARRIAITAASPYSLRVLFLFIFSAFCSKKNSYEKRPPTADR